MDLFYITCSIWGEQGRSARSKHPSRIYAHVTITSSEVIAEIDAYKQNVYGDI